MEIKINISNPSDNLVLQKIKKVDNSTFKDTDYRKMFNDFKEIGLIHGEYKSTRWSMYDELQDMQIEISFDMNAPTLLKNGLKYFTLLRIHNSKKPMTIYNEIYNIKKCITNSDGLNSPAKLELYLQEEYTKSKHHGGNLANDLKQFLSFMKLKNSDELECICKDFPTAKTLNRELPNLKDVLIFDEILNDYFKKYDSEVTFRYLPIMLWWLITNIIPQRPSEFLKLEKDCLEVSQVDGKDKYFIKIHRIKNDNKIESLEVDKLTFNLIKNNIDKITTKIKNDTPYLFPIDFYYFGKIKSSRRRKSNDRLNRRDFYLILNDFYEQVVMGIYKIDKIEKIKFGDTRHFAIINMCLQGFNMLSVANMAGHKSIYTQNEYFSHAKQFATSSVYLMAQKNIGFAFSSNFSNGLVGWKEFVFDKGKTISLNELHEKEIVGPIDHGICSELKQVFPKYCITDCRFCTKFYFKPNISDFDEGINWLINGSNYMNDKIENAIDFMKEIVTNSSNNNNRAAQNTLQTTSRNLMNYMDLKAIVDMKIMGSDKGNEF